MNKLPIINPSTIRFYSLGKCSYMFEFVPIGQDGFKLKLFEQKFYRDHFEQIGLFSGIELDEYDWFMEEFAKGQSYAVKNLIEVAIGKFTI